MSTICLGKTVSNIHRTCNVKCFPRVMTYCLNDTTTDNRERYNGLFVHRTSQLYYHRLFSSKHVKEIRKQDIEKPAYLELYLLEKIRFIRLLGRFSKYSCLSLILGAPLCILSTSLNAMPLETSKFIISNLGFYSAIFCGQSFIFSSRIIGKIMVSEDEQTIKLSHVSLFGNRKDVYVKPSDIVPLQDVQSAFSNKKMVMVNLKNSKRFIFLPGLGTAFTNFEAIEMIFSGSNNVREDKE